MDAAPPTGARARWCAKLLQAARRAPPALAPDAPVAPVEAPRRAFVRAGTAHLAQGQDAEALRAFARAMDDDPFDDEACLGRVAALRHLGRMDRALSACEAALCSCPGSERLIDARKELIAEIGAEDAESDGGSLD